LQLSLKYPGSEEVTAAHKTAAKVDLLAVHGAQGRLARRGRLLATFAADCGAAGADLEARIASLEAELASLRRAEASAAGLAAAMRLEAEALRTSAVVVALNFVLREGWLAPPPES